MGVFHFLKKNKNVETDNGWNEIYYENGRGSLEEKYFKKNGKKNGEFIAYDGLGSIKAKGHYKDGKKEGKWTYWYDNGKLHKNYKQGRIIKEDKLIREWKDYNIKIIQAGKGKYNFLKKGKIKIQLEKTIPIKKITLEVAEEIITEKVFEMVKSRVVQKEASERLLKDIDKSGGEDEQKKSFRNHLLKEIDTLNKELDDIRASYSEGNSETSDDPKS